MNKNDLKAFVKKRIADDRQTLDAIETDERIKENNSLIGKCFAYRNCYSCPKGPEDYWTLWIRVTGVGDDGWLRTFQFETDVYGETRMKEARHGASLGEPTTLAKYRTAWRRASKAVAVLGKKHCE